MRLLPFLLLLIPSFAHAQAWTLDPGEGYLRLSVGLTAASERFAADGTVVPYDARLEGTSGAAFRDESMYLYGEVGLLDQLTLTASVPVKRVTLRDPGAGEPVARENTDLGTARLGLRLGLEDAVGLDDRSALAVTFGIGLPLGYQRNVVPTVGAGQVDGELLVAYGRAFDPIPAYAQLALGYRLRSGIYGFSRRAECPTIPAADGPRCFEPGEEVRYSDEWLYRAEVGTTPWDWLLVQVFGDLMWSVDLPRAVEPVGGVVQPDRFPARRVGRIGGGVTATLFGETGLAVQVFQPVYGRNALRATEVFVGIETRF